MGARVYWHGVFPDPSRTGRIVRRGTVRHEVLWDGATETTLEPVAFIQLLSRVRRCCGYCTARMAEAAARRGPTEPTEDPR